MSITGRDRRILLVLVPLVALLAYWFLLLAPTRDEAVKAGDELSKQEAKLDDARSELAQLESANDNFKTEYTAVVRLGKAVPSRVDMASLIVQLDQAAHGTGIRFARIATGQRTSAPAAPAGGATPPGGSTSRPADAGGKTAQSAPGSVAENAGNAVNSANAKESANNQLNTKTSEPVRGGSVPVGGGGTATTAGGQTSGVPGLDSVPLELTFRGNFFQLADLLHRMKRFVRVANDRILVRGRLMTIDGFTLKRNQQGSGLEAEVKATVYLVPKAQGVTGGATPDGPAATPTTPAGTTTPAPAAATATPPTP